MTNESQVNKVRVQDKNKTKWKLVHLRKQGDSLKSMLNAVKYICKLKSN